MKLNINSPYLFFIEVANRLGNNYKVIPNLKKSTIKIVRVDLISGDQIYFTPILWGKIDNVDNVIKVRVKKEFKQKISEIINSIIANFNSNFSPKDYSYPIKNFIEEQKTETEFPVSQIPIKYRDWILCELFILLEAGDFVDIDFKENKILRIRDNKIEGYIKRYKNGRYYYYGLFWETLIWLLNRYTYNYEKNKIVYSENGISPVKRMRAKKTKKYKSYLLKFYDGIHKELKEFFKYRYPDIDYGIDILVNSYNSGYPNGVVITFYTPETLLIRLELHDDDIFVTPLSDQGRKTFLAFLKTKKAKI